MGTSETGARPLGLVRLLASALVLACAPSTDTRATSDRPPLIVVAVDGLEWSVLLPLVRAGELPHLGALMQRGAWGELATQEPTLSPVLWTTIATGKPPLVHGIEGFTVPATGTGEERLVQSGDRRCKAFWNIASSFGKRTAVLGWWATYPAEPVAPAQPWEGLMVSQRSVAGAELAKGGLFPELDGQVTPVDREAWVGGTRDAVLADERETDPGLAPWAEILALPAASVEALPALERRLLEHCRASLRADETYARLALDLLHEELPFDLLAVYFGSPDVFGHRFWRYREPERYAAPIDEDVLARCAELIDANVRWIDAWIGRLVAAAGPDANVVVLSDHGMHAVGLENAYGASDPLPSLNSGHHLDAPPAVWIAAGPSVRRWERPLDAQPRPLLDVLDVLPTWLAWLDIPSGRDMPGSVAEETTALDLLRSHPPRRIATHEDGAPPRQPPAADSNAAERARMQELRALGYLESGER